MSLGLYLSVPFCRTKCSYCNFASGVFSRALFEGYVNRVCAEIERAAETAEQMGGRFERDIDSLYLGGGTPTVLDGTQLRRLFVTISQNFRILPGAETTVECAPGTLSAAVIETLQSCGVNRVSLGVQSFVDREAAAVGRLHQRKTVEDDISRLRAAGLANLSVDLIAGLPHQTAASWEVSLAAAVDSGLPHVSVYMLEVDEDSRLGRELLAGGTRYHAHFVPDEDLTADLYDAACDRLEAAGVEQYEISNFARPGCQSRHNLKYWTRQPYLGFGVDAHSMLEAPRLETGPASTESPVRRARSSEIERSRTDGAAPGPTRQGQDPSFLEASGNRTGLSSAGQSASDAIPGRESPGFRRWADEPDAVRFATPDSLDGYLAAQPLLRTPVAYPAAIEETFFLGLRLNQGVDLEKIAAKFGKEGVGPFFATIREFRESGLLERQGEVIRLTPRGRLLSNEVFEKFVLVAGGVG
jgi:oxygen-independent coproporphyrinogen III oxidase